MDDINEYPNHLADFRKKSGLSQRALAERVGVSQPTIQRAEADREGNTPIMLMMQIADVLGVAYKHIWPGTLDMKMTPDLPEGAIMHSVRVKMKGIPTPFVFPISTRDADRLYRCVQDTDGYLCFDSENWSVVLNAANIQWSNFLWDPASLNSDEADDAGHVVKVWFVGESEPQVFEASPDEMLDDEEDDNEGAIHHMLLALDMYGAYLDAEPVRFVDEDGEDVWLNAAEINVICLDRALHDSDLMRAQLDGVMEDAVEARDAGQTH